MLKMAKAATPQRKLYNEPLMLSEAFFLSGDGDGESLPPPSPAPSMVVDKVELTKRFSSPMACFSDLQSDQS